MNIALSADSGLAYDFRHLIATLSDEVSDKKNILELQGENDAQVVCSNTTDVMAALVDLMESSQTKVIRVRAIFKRSPLEYRFAFVIASRDFGLPLKLVFEDESVLLLHSNLENDDQGV